MQSSWWGAPRTITARINDRKISWIELFSDLIYVVIIHSIVANLAETHNANGIFSAIVVFLFVVNSWNNMVLYFDWHGANNLRTLFFSFLQTMTIAIVAIFIPAFFAGHYAYFIVAYTLNQLTYIYLWRTTVRFDEAHRSTAIPYFEVYLTGSLLLLAALLPLPLLLQRLLIVVSIVFFLTPATFFGRRWNDEFNSRNIPFKLSSAMLERYGLFAMIVLGESVAGLIEHASKHFTHVASYGKFSVLLLATIGMGFVYYTSASELLVHTKANIGLVLFRGTNIAIIGGLTLQSFFVTVVFESKARWAYIGYFLCTAGLLILIRWMATTRFFNMDQRPINHQQEFLITGISCVLLLLAIFLPQWLGFIASALLLIGNGIRNWRLEVQ